MKSSNSGERPHQDSRREGDIDIDNRSYMLALSSKAAANCNFDQRPERGKAFTAVYLRVDTFREAIHLNY